jgi:hypothetical protein
MLVTIRNLAGYLLICVLNSGRTLHLGPAEISEPLDQSEVNGNDKIDKLVRARLISIAPADVAGTKTEEPQAGTTHGSVTEPVEPRSARIALAGEPQPPRADPMAHGTAAAVAKASLSRFQFLIFTFVIGGLFLLLSIRAGTFVEIPTNVLALLGISAGSYLVAQAVK